MKISDTVNVLGTEYKIEVKDFSDDETLNGADGVCKNSMNIILLNDLTVDEDWKKESNEAISNRMKKCLRHEIVHAFYKESGLMENSLNYESGWSRNEEMIDWFSIQGEKIYKAWKEAGAL